MPSTFKLVPMVVLAAGVVGCRASRPPVIGDAPGDFPSWSLALYPALAAPAPPSAGGEAQARVALGRLLYHEPFTAAGRTVSCSTCHALTSSTTTAGRRGATMVFNAGGRLDQLPDSDAANVEQRSARALIRPDEMAMPDTAVVLAQLRQSPRLRAAFHEAFPGEADPITFENVGLAMGAFVRELVTPSRWDRFLEGDSTALTPAEREGFATFVNAGCSECHNGAYVGARMYRNLGVARPWPGLTATGRAGALGDRPLKVASLRNVEVKVGPYFHFGSVTDLSQAVRMMGRYQAGEELTDRQVDAIVTWLRALTGRVPRGVAAPAASR